MLVPLFYMTFVTFAFAYYFFEKFNLIKRPEHEDQVTDSDAMLMEDIEESNEMSGKEKSLNC